MKPDQTPGANQDAGGVPVYPKSTTRPPRTPQREIGCPHGFGVVHPCPKCGTPRHLSTSEFVTTRFLQEVEAGQRTFPPAIEAEAAAPDAGLLAMRQAAYDALDANPDDDDYALCDRIVDGIRALAGPDINERDFVAEATTPEQYRSGAAHPAPGPDPHKGHEPGSDSQCAACQPIPE